MKINIKDSTMLRPAQRTPSRHLWTSNLDLVVSRYHVANVFFYRYNGSSDYFETRLLKDSLSKILVPLYPMAGRLGSDQNGRLEIVCNFKGVLFVEAESDATLDDFGDFSPSPRLRQLAPAVDYSGHISSNPLVLLQHTLMDGNSLYYFMNCWANTTRGLPLNVMPFLDRTVLRASIPPTPLFHHVEYDPSPPMNPTNPHFQAAPKPSTSAVFNIDVNQLKILKTKSYGNRARTDYSTFNIVAAHVWRCVCKARGLSDDQATKLYVPADGRSKLDPPLPPSYFGNAVFIAATTALSGDLHSEPFASTVERISSMLKRMDNKYLRSALDYMESVPDMKSLVRGAHTFQSPNLAINNLIRFPSYDADFGWGRPIHSGFAYIIHEGKISIFPSAVGDGSLSLVACLETSCMKRFEKFLYDFSLPSEKISARY